MKVCDIKLSDLENLQVKRKREGLKPKTIDDEINYARPIAHFSTALKTACEEVGVIWGREVKDGFTFHNIRHTFITDMRKAGVSKSVRMSITGHAPKDMDDRYNKVDDSDKLKAIIQLEAYRESVRQEGQKTEMLDRR